MSSKQKLRADAWVQVLCHVTTRLQQLHEAGLAHRDLKPGNVLWRPEHLEWTLIDFGCAARIGARRCFVLFALGCRQPFMSPVFGLAMRLRCRSCCVCRVCRQPRRRRLVDAYRHSRTSSMPPALLSRWPGARSKPMGVLLQGRWLA